MGGGHSTRAPPGYANKGIPLFFCNSGGFNFHTVTRVTEIIMLGRHGRAYLTSYASKINFT